MGVAVHAGFPLTQPLQNPLHHSQALTRRARCKRRLSAKLCQVSGINGGTAASTPPINVFSQRNATAAQRDLLELCKHIGRNVRAQLVDSRILLGDFSLQGAALFLE